jgi:hypothetical protein
VMRARGELAQHKKFVEAAAARAAAGHISIRYIESI